MIIAYSGKIGSGKDTAGLITQWLIANKTHPQNTPTLEVLLSNKFQQENARMISRFGIRRFADSLKDMVCILTNCTREQLENRDFKEEELGREWRKYYVTDKDGKKVNDITFLKEIEVQKCIEFLERRGKSNLRYSYDSLTRRTLLQLLGTECGRQIIHPNIWVNALMAKYVTKITPLETSEQISKNRWLNYPNWIITDMRFPNELQAVQDKGGITIRINRSGNYIVNGDYSTLKADDLHNVVNQVFKSEHESETALDNATFDYVIENNGTIEELAEKINVIMHRVNII